jgi:hypothetical protein
MATIHTAVTEYVVVAVGVAITIFPVEEFKLPEGDHV